MATVTRWPRSLQRMVGAIHSISFVRYRVIVPLRRIVGQVLDKLPIISPLPDLINGFFQGPIQPAYGNANGTPWSLPIYVRLMRAFVG
jgi:hypothetical protein